MLRRQVSILIRKVLAKEATPSDELMLKLTLELGAGQSDVR